jgi:hypothetical protein
MVTNLIGRRAGQAPPLQSEVNGEVIQNSTCSSQILSKLREPLHARFAAEPGDLALGVAAGGLLEDGDGVGQRNFSAQVGAQFTIVAKELLKRLGSVGTGDA